MGLPLTGSRLASPRLTKSAVKSLSYNYSPQLPRNTTNKLLPHVAGFARKFAIIDVSRRLGAGAFPLRPLHFWPAQRGATRMRVPRPSPVLARAGVFRAVFAL